MSEDAASRRPFEAALGAAAIVCRNVAIAFLATMAGLIVLQVIGRNFFDLGMPWADELARFCGVAMVFLGAPYLSQHGRQVSVDILRDALPEGARRAALAIGEFATLLFCVLALWSLQAFLARAGKFTTPTLGLSNWIFYAPAVVGAALMAAIAVERIIAILSGRAVETGAAPQP